MFSLSDSDKPSQQWIQWVVGGSLVLFWLAAIFIMGETTDRSQIDRPESSLPKAYIELPRPQSFELAGKGCFELRRAPNVFVSCPYLSIDSSNEVVEFYREQLLPSKWQAISPESRQFSYSDNSVGTVLVSVRNDKRFVYVIERKVAGDNRSGKQATLYELILTDGPSY